MENEINKGDLVSYYDGGYTVRILNEEGEMEVWDWHLYASGRVLTILEKQVLVLFYSCIDENPRPIRDMILDELSVEWVSINRLKQECENETKVIL